MPAALSPDPDPGPPRPDDAPAVAAGHCPVCAGGLAEGRVVTCARCETAHHLDCIEYGGGCALYACGSRAYRKPGARLEWVARPAAASSQLVKPRDPDEHRALAVVERAVVRVEARRVGRSSAAAAVVGTLAVCAVAAALGPISPGTVAALRLLMQGLRELASIQVLIAAVLVISATTVAWVGLSVGLRALGYGLGFLVHRADTSEFVLDRESRRLIRRTRLLALPPAERAWPASAIMAVRLSADGAGDPAPVRLEVVLAGGKTVLLADDSNAFLQGYHWSELGRIAQRLATELDAPLEWLLPWKPQPGSKAGCARSG